MNDKAKPAQAAIYFHDIGDYLTREEKLAKITAFHSVAGITAANAWTPITPDDHGDWLKQRDDNFAEFIVMGGKKSVQMKLFENFSLGVVTNRDAWVYNFSQIQLREQCQGMVSFYNEEIDRYKKHVESTGDESLDVQLFVQKQLDRISWGGGNWQASFKKGQKESFEDEKIRQGLYRPFCKIWHYGAIRFNHSFYSMPRLFPDSAAENLVIQINAKYTGNGQLALISSALPDLHCNGDSQCFPLYLYEESVAAEAADDLFGGGQAAAGGGKIRRDAITDDGLAHFRAAYPGEKLTKEDIFYYVYGLLHSEDYRARYADNLSKELPRIPCVKNATDFWTFSQAGRALANLHLNYETVAPHPVTIAAPANPSYRVKKMKYGKTKRDGRSVDDKTTLIYNEQITLTGIPLEAYEYVVNGKPALDWVVERQCVKTDKDSGITNDANLWATETMHNPKYPLELFQRVITVSLETMKIVQALPPLAL